MNKLVFKPTIIISSFIKILHIYLRNYLISSILQAVQNAMSIKPSIILRIIGKICEHNNYIGKNNGIGIAEKNNAQLY